MKVFNVLGQEVATLVNQQQNAGNYTVNFDAKSLASGIYLYRIQAGSFVSTMKMTLLK
ncbi:MAG: T9SS type A sorting domain-containing protein [Ignavibacteriaceae bacterium]